MVKVRQLAQLVRNSLHGVQPNCGVPLHPRRHAELAGHAPLQPEKERMLCVAPVQERGPTQHSTRGSHRRTDISSTCANRNVVDTNVRIVSPQTHTMDVALAALAHTRCRDDTLHTHWQVYDLRTSCTDTNTCTRNSSSKYGGIPGRAALTWLIGSCFLGCGCSGDIQSAIRVGNSRGKGRELEPDSGPAQSGSSSGGSGSWSD